MRIFSWDSSAENVNAAGAERGSVCFPPRPPLHPPPFILTNFSSSVGLLLTYFSDEETEVQRAGIFVGAPKFEMCLICCFLKIDVNFCFLLQNLYMAILI